MPQGCGRLILRHVSTPKPQIALRLNTPSLVNSGPLGVRRSDSFALQLDSRGDVCGDAAIDSSCMQIRRRGVPAGTFTVKTSELRTHRVHCIGAPQASTLEWETERQFGATFGYL